MRGFGHAVGLDHGRAEGRFELGHHGRRQRGGGRADQAQGGFRDDLLVAGGAGEDQLVHGRHGGVPARRGLAQPAEDAHRVEAGRAPGAAARADAREHAGDQPVDVEQRHDVEATVAGRERQGGGDVGGGGADVALAQGHDLGPRGRAGGVQDERDVLRFGGTGARGRAADARFEGEGSGGSGVVGDEFDDRDAAAGGGLAGWGIDALLDDQRGRIEVAQVEVEFVAAVAGVERRGGGGGGDGEEGGGHFGAVGQDDRDGVFAAEAEAVERLCRALNLRAQGGEGQRFALRRAEHGGLRGMRGEQVGDGPGRRCGGGGHGRLLSRRLHLRCSVAAGTAYTRMRRGVRVAEGADLENRYVQ